MAWKRCAVGALAALLLLGLAVPGGAAEGKEFAAAASNVFYVPGKAVTCVLGSAVWVAAMAASLGGVYNGATNIVRETCGGRWVLKASDIRYYPSLLNTPPAFPDDQIGAR